MRIFGDPLHPMLVHFPIALWTIASACDLLTLTGVAGAWPVAWLAIVIGSATALPTAIAGLLAIAELDDEAARVANRHMLLMLSALTAYCASLWLRSNGMRPAPEPSVPPILLGMLGFLLLTAGGRMGAALVYRHGAGRYGALKGDGR